MKTLAEDLVGEQAELKLTAFETRYARLIDFGANTFHMVNRTRVTATGVELLGRYTTSAGVTLQAAYTWIRRRSDEPLRGLPRERANLGWPWQPGDSLRMNADCVHVGRTAVFSTPTGKAMLPGHDRVDVSLQQRLTPRLTLEAAIYTGFGERAASYIGFAQPGRRSCIDLRAAVKDRADSYGARP